LTDRTNTGPIDEERITLKNRVEHFIDSNTVTIFMTVVTIYALFGDDVRMLAFSKDADTTFFAVSTFALVCFALELGLSCWAKPGYTFSFYFWLDLIATISLIPDIGFLWDPMTGADEEESDSSTSDGE
jgi:hypothetical protein